VGAGSRVLPDAPAGACLRARIDGRHICCVRLLATGPSRHRPLRLQQARPVPAPPDDWPECSYPRDGRRVPALIRCWSVYTVAGNISISSARRMAWVIGPSILQPLEPDQSGRRSDAQIKRGTRWNTARDPVPLFLSALSAFSWFPRRAGTVPMANQKNTGYWRMNSAVPVVVDPYGLCWRRVISARTLSLPEVRLLRWFRLRRRHHRPPPPPPAAAALNPTTAAASCRGLRPPPPRWSLRGKDHVRFRRTILTSDRAELKRLRVPNSMRLVVKLHGADLQATT